MEEVTALKITMAELKTNLENFNNKLSEHINDQKESDGKVENNFKEVFRKIDNLGFTFQGKIQDKADHKEVIELLEKNYVTKEAFSNVQKMVYAFVGALLLAALYFIFRKVGLTI